MTEDQIHSELVRWLAGLTKVPVIKMYQSGDRPALPYIAVNFTTLIELRDHPMDIEFQDVAPDVMATPVIETEWSFSVHAYGDKPTNYLRPVRSAAFLNEIAEPLTSKGLTVHEISQIRNVPEYVQNVWEPRAQMDIQLRGLAKDGHLVHVIEEAPMQIERA